MWRPRNSCGRGGGSGVGCGAPASELGSMWSRAGGPAMLAFLFGIIACEPHDPVGPQVQRDSTVSAQRVTVYPEERAAWALAQAVPASAGFYIDTASGNVVVSLTTLRQAAAARSVFQSRITSVLDRKSTRLNSSHPSISYAVFCLK